MGGGYLGLEQWASGKQWMWERPNWKDKREKAARNCAKISVGTSLKNNRELVEEIRQALALC
jgi:hypothetical protein